MTDLVTIFATNGAGTVTAVDVMLPYSTSWGARNVIHQLIGGGIAVSLVAPQPRSGTFVVFFGSEDAAYACAQLHQQESSFTLEVVDRSHLGMTYVVDSSVSISLDTDAARWKVTVGFQEIT